MWRLIYPLIFLLLLSTDTLPAKGQEHWVITQTVSGFSYDTETETAKRRETERRGLLSYSTSGKNRFISYWSDGAYRATTLYNGKTVVDGHDLNDVSRISSFRFNKSGSTAYIRTTKGPTSIVEMIVNGYSVAHWPRLSQIKLLAFRGNALVISHFRADNQTTEFWQYKLQTTIPASATGEKIGAVEGCAVLASKVVKAGIALEVYCHRSTGSDISFLDFKSGKVSTIIATEKDEILGYGLARSKKTSIPVLSIDGTKSARQFYHASTGIFLSLLGEPMAYASDEGGKQSWSQSYRTRILAILSHKTAHPVFATLARQAMHRTLGQQNKRLKISGTYNPACAWASRIYSNDKKSPISLLINQAMISSSLIEACKQLGSECPVNLQKRILDNAACLVRENEIWFTPEKGLYRIPYNAPFRYDGVWAPWNWHMMWVSVLHHVGLERDRPALMHRAHSLQDTFLASWEPETLSDTKSAAALWRYWPQAYYDGWTKQDQISVSRQSQKRKDLDRERYEDLNHAGISLLGLSDLGFSPTPVLSRSLSRRIDRLLEHDPFLPRDMDGKGPRSPRWRLGAGWHMFATDTLRMAYTRKMPGNRSNGSHLAYAKLYDPAQPFQLTLSLLQCKDRKCSKTMTWNYGEARRFLEKNPLFSIAVKE